MLDWATAAQFMKERPKARENAERYAIRAAQNAAAAAERRQRRRANACFDPRRYIHSGRKGRVCAGFGRL
jgi:hypothetical protein